MEFFYKVSSESLKGIGGSKQDKDPARVDGERVFAIS